MKRAGNEGLLLTTDGNINWRTVTQLAQPKPRHAAERVPYTRATARFQMVDNWPPRQRNEQQIEIKQQPNSNKDREQITSY